VKQYVATDYDGRSVEAARRVLLELSRVLGEYEQEITVVGGWVPPLLIPNAGHVGSTDVDLALDHDALQEPRYETLRALLERSSYYAAEYGLAGKGRQSQPVQDVRARKARGSDLVFDRQLIVDVPVEGRLPNGAKLRAHVRVAGPVPFLVMKANAVTGRDKPKEAYDIWFLLSLHPAGLKGLAEAVNEHAEHGLVHEALGHLADAFASLQHIGPRSVADFLELEPGTEEYDRVRQDAYQRVQYILNR